jgi:hypothetical protein
MARDKYERVFVVNDIKLNTTGDAITANPLPFAGGSVVN